MFQDSFQFIKNNRRLLTAGFLLCFFSTFGQTVFIGAHIPFILIHFDLSYSEISLFYAAATLCSAALLLWTGKYIDHLRLSMLLPLVLCGLALGALVLAFAPHPIFLFLAFFLLRQCGQGMMPLTSTICMNRYLEKGRGRAMAISNIGSPAHMMIMPFTGLLIVGMIGWQMAWVSYAVFILIILIPLFFWLFRNHERTTHAAWKTRMAAAEASEETPDSKQWQRTEALKDWRFYCLISVLIIAPCFNTAIFFYQGELALNAGISSTAFTSSFISFTAGAITAGIISGMIIDRYGEKYILLIFPLVFMTGLLVLSCFTGYMAIVVALTTIGIADGMVVVLGGPLLAKFYGTKHLGSIKSVIISINVVATALSPPLVGILLDQSVAISSIFFGFALYACLGWVILFIFLRPKLL